MADRKPKRVRAEFTLPPQLVRDLRARAAAFGRVTSELAEEALDQYLDRLDGQAEQQRRAG